MRWIDRVAALLVLLFGIAHVVVGYRVFIAPTERGVWFLSAGLLLILIGMANLSCSVHSPTSRLSITTALVGNISLLLVGALLVVAAPGSMTSPQALVLLALGLVLAVMRARQLVTRALQG